MAREPFGGPEMRSVCGREKLRGELHDVRTVNRHRWVRRVASGERVKRGQGTRHNDPVTSEEGMPPAVARFTLVAVEGGRESAQATVYEKHRCVPSRIRRRIRTDACPVPE